MPRIVIDPGLPSARAFELKQGDNSLGRGPANDIIIEAPSVSTSHCQIVVSGAQARIKDLGSTNGTFLNNTQVSEGDLAPGQPFRLGSVEVMFQVDAAQTAKSPVVPIKVRLISPSVKTSRASAAGMPTAPAPTAAPVEARLAPPSAVAPVQPSVPSATPAATRLAVPNSAPHVAAPAPVVSMPPHPSRVVEGFHGCRHHPKTQGRNYCAKCDRYYCDVCVTTRHGEGGTRVTCRQCGGDCELVIQQIVRQEAPGFFAQLPGAFAYPLRGGGAMMILVGMFILAMLKIGQIMLGVGSLRLLICGIVLSVFAGGYLFAFLQNILQSTGSEDREIPDLPGITNVLEDIVLPFGRFMGLNILCFAPAIAVGVWANVSHSAFGGQAFVTAMLIGGAYFPMAFLAVALHDSILVANPVLVIPSIFKVPIEYFVSLLAFGAFLGSQALGDYVSKTVFPDSFSTQSMGQLFLMIGVRLLWAFFNFYLIVVAIRILGTIFVTRKERLGWFQAQ